MLGRTPSRPQPQTNAKDNKPRSFFAFIPFVYYNSSQTPSTDNVDDKKDKCRMLK